MVVKSIQMKRRSQPAFQRPRKPRSRIPRRRRSRFSPILRPSVSPISSGDAKAIVSVFASFPVDSSCSSLLQSEVSCDSSRVSVAVEVEKKAKPLRKRAIDEIGAYGAVGGVRDDEIPRVTRKCIREKVRAEASESSCADSSSAAVELRRFGKQSSKASFAAPKCSEAISRSKISCVEQFVSGGDEISQQCPENFLKTDSNDASKSKNSSKIEVEKLPEKLQSVCSSISEIFSNNEVIGDGESTGSEEVKLSAPSPARVTSNFTVSRSESTGEQKAANSGCYSDLACTEEFSYEDVSDYASSLENTYSESFPIDSLADLSDYTPSMLLESAGSSDQSQENSTPSYTFSLFGQFCEQFARLSPPVLAEEEYQHEFRLLRFAEDDDEESYQEFRTRERRQPLSNYAEKYHSTTEYGDLILQQRLQMVQWIIEQSGTKKLQNETMFLSVNLFDRFLSKGFFKTKRNIQIMGVACLTLATRIEENQPLNTVQERTFCVGFNVYSRCEAVAMEWLVQKVLNFRCFLPTIYNFLWFYLKAARAGKEVEKRAKFLAVQALLDHKQLSYWPSTVAAGLVILASLSANQDASCQSVMEIHVRTKDDDLSECIKSLEWLVQYVS